MAFIEISLGSHMISHGYDADNKEVLEHVEVAGFSKKVVAVSRIKSLSEKYILTDYLDGRWIYWAYAETFDEVKNKLVNPC
ncbi:hypothetical protein ACFFU1_09535 [Algibacter miyuki]|uniref:Uncharacterized protein n=1 Tax=Algibacter miyuki TaxID=1306933 RepID=A0ABV5GZU2_9FLAO|nr:hypothetical protein [Algibacter miyuki]MDN3666662.1 hypothetical protein [Algibacter miyuki]